MLRVCPEMRENLFRQHALSSPTGVPPVWTSRPKKKDNDGIDNAGPFPILASRPRNRD